MLNTVINDRKHFVEELGMAHVTQDVASDLIRADHVGNDIPAFATKLAHLMCWLALKSSNGLGSGDRVHGALMNCRDAGMAVCCSTPVGCTIINLEKSFKAKASGSSVEVTAQEAVLEAVISHLSTDSAIP
jgi:hypothetical protein